MDGDYSSRGKVERWSLPRKELRPRNPHANDGSSGSLLFHAKSDPLFPWSRQNPILREPPPRKIIIIIMENNEVHDRVARQPQGNTSRQIEDS